MLLGLFYIKWIFFFFYIYAEHAKETQECTFSVLSRYLKTADFYQPIPFPKSLSTLHAVSPGIPAVTFSDRR